MLSKGGEEGNPLPVAAREVAKETSAQAPREVLTDRKIEVIHKYKGFQAQDFLGEFLSRGGGDTAHRNTEDPHHLTVMEMVLKKELVIDVL